jgi:hypothetical protein
MPSLQRELFWAAARIMRVVAPIARRPGMSKLLRHWPADAWLFNASAIYLLIVLLLPTVWTIALGIYWISNTVSHNFIHQPFFRSRRLNRCFAIYLSAITGIPQRLWRDRHLAHHAGVRPGAHFAKCALGWRFRCSRELLTQTLIVASLWAAAFKWNAQFAISTLVPGFVGALVLCGLHGYYEHARGTTSHYGALYNALFFNDGLHVEHHRAPKAHWSELRPAQAARESRWPAVIRWLDLLSLSGLERLAARSFILRRWVLKKHECALRKIWGGLPPPERVAIVGGGLFPRSAIVVRRLWPLAHLIIYEADPDHLEEARQWLSGDEFCVNTRVTSPDDCTADLVIVPLALDLDKAAFYSPAAGLRVVVQDWLWRRRTKRTAIVSLLLLKRMNLVEA